MPVVTIKMLEGRSREQKAAVMREVAVAVAANLEVALPAVRVLIEEVPPEHWSVGGVSKAEAVPATDGVRHTGAVP